MKIKINFNYTCKIHASEEEINNITKNLDDENTIFELTENINDIFLSGDGRTEAGMISNFNYEVKSDEEI